MKILRPEEILFLLIWSSGYIGAKIGVPFADTFTLLFYRYGLVLLAVAAIVSWRREWRAPDAASLSIGFMAHFLWLILVIKAIELGLNAGAAALLAAVQPMLTALLAPWVLGEKNSAYAWLGIALGFAGVCIFVSGDAVFGGVALWIYALPTLAMLCLTAVTLIERRGQIKTTNLPLMTSLFWQGAITFILIAPLAVWFECLTAAWGIELIFSVVWLALVVSVGSYGMMFYLIRTRPATRAAALQYFTPPVTMLIAFLIFGEKLNLLGMIGMAITFAGFYCLHRAEQNSPALRCAA